MSQKLSESVDSFWLPKPLVEMARLGDMESYSFWVYNEPLKNPSFHLRHKTDFEIVIQADGFIVLEIKHNDSRYKFAKGEQPPKPVLSLIQKFMSAVSTKDTSRTNQQAFDFAWKLLND
jgi:hypothetical protein